MMITIYIGNLPTEVTENSLRKTFEKFGKVNKANVAVDNFSKNKLGFGFVEMPGVNQAQEAIEALHHTQIKGRTVMVCETKSRNERRKATAEHKEVAHV
jgi:RNA recognition motif-containing protein